MAMRTIMMREAMMIVIRNSNMVGGAEEVWMHSGWRIGNPIRSVLPSVEEVVGVKRAKRDGVEREGVTRRFRARLRCVAALERWDMMHPPI